MKTLLYSLRNWLMFQTPRQLSHQLGWALKCHFVSDDPVSDAKHLVTEVLLVSVGLSHVGGDPITPWTYLTVLQKDIIAKVQTAGYKVFLSGRWAAE